MEPSTRVVISSAILLALLLVVPGCARNEEVTIGYIGPLTGDAASAGVPNLRGIELAVAEINLRGGISGRPVRLVAEDDRLDDTRTIAAYEKLRGEGTVAILSPSYGGLLALSPRIDEDGIVVIESLDVSDQIAAAGDKLFGIGIWDEGIGYALADFAREDLGEDKVAFVFFDGDPITTLIKESFRERFEELGGEVVSEQGYGFDTSDFRPILLKIEASGAKTVVVVGFDEAGLLLKQARESGSNFTFLGWDQFNTEGFKRNAGSAARGAHFTFWSAPDAQAYEVFKARYESRYREELVSPTFAVTGYDAMMTLADAMEASGTGSEQLAGGLYAIRDRKGVAGNITMGEDGVVRTIKEHVFTFDEELKPVRSQ